MLGRSTLPTLRSLAATTPATLQRVQARSMVSTVLLTRESYAGTKVTDLKAELKQRSLSTTGKREVLIDRLVENDSRRAAGKANVSRTSTPATVAAAAAASASARPMSSTTATQAVPTSTPPTPSPGAVGLQSQGASVSHPPDMEPGQVSSLKDALPDQIKELAEPDANPPGLPPQKNPAPPITFDVKIPYYAEPPEKGPKIPLFTSYLDPSHRSSTDVDPSAPRPFLPRVLAVSSPEAVSHHHGDTALFDPSTSSSSISASSDSKKELGFVSELLQQLKADLGITTEAVEEAAQKAQEAGQAMEEETSEARKVLQEVGEVVKKDTSKVVQAASANVGALTGQGEAKGSSGSGASATGADEGISPRSYSGGNDSGSNSSNSSSSSGFTAPSSETTGALLLGAIVAAGYTLGSLGAPSEAQKAKLRVELEKIKKQGEWERMQFGQVKRPAEWSDREVEKLVREAEEALK